VTSWISTHRRLSTGVALLAVIGLVALLSSRDTGSAGAPAAGESVTTSPAAAATPPANSAPSTTVAEGGDEPAEDPNAELATGLPGATVDLPVDVTVTTGPVGSDGLATTSVHITADAGSQVFGAEARLCPADASVTQDADFRPTQTGRCVLHPLRAGADDHLEVAGAAPYQEVDLTFRTGSGTDTYLTQDGTSVTVTCDAAHPCSLVLKVQVPNTYGFAAYPIPFA
jgi:hypothetical protein